MPRATSSRLGEASRATSSSCALSVSIRSKCGTVQSGRVQRYALLLLGAVGMIALGVYPTNVV